MAKRDRNACWTCGHMWFPRGRPVSLRCPGCGSPETGLARDLARQARAPEAARDALAGLPRPQSHGGDDDAGVDAWAAHKRREEEATRTALMIGLAVGALALCWLAFVA